MYRAETSNYEEQRERVAGVFVGFGRNNQVRKMSWIPVIDHKSQFRTTEDFGSSAQGIQYTPLYDIQQPQYCKTRDTAD